ncbi:CoA transferase [Nocardioides marmoriginsengisoli]|uniref:CoA transferase n=1 Tax=Nocardioides marmoriginsengisoli TaxID=661483 RepID=A0A3N0CHP9_9ACTN|nr:CoA transferase [Nocardioides marmoriginsengisoli]RNL62809.1 CoA transferase [Nocardioides marmoriginsengisoli]
MADHGHPPVVGPLDGVTVLDMTTSYAGPTGSMYLAELGARVIKIERPGSGDDARHWGPPFVDGTSAWFASANRNKESVVLDVRKPGGLEVLHLLLAEADVFMENLNPDKLAGLRLDPETIRARHPRLIYCAVSGFGLDGPDSGLPGYDLVAQARSGLMSVTGAKGGPPQRVSTALSDIVAGMSAALAICAAVVRQRAHGTGDLIDISLLDGDLALMAPRIASFLAGEPEPGPSGGTDSVLAVYQTFVTADRDIAVAIGNDLMWQRFCGVLGLAELVADAALTDNAGRRAQRGTITAVVADRLRERPAAEWLKVLDEADVPASAVKTLSEVVDDPQVRARGNLLPVADAPGLFGVRAPFRLASVPVPPNQPVPALGAHSRAVLASLGCTDDQISELVAAGAVHVRDKEVHDD